MGTITIYPGPNLMPIKSLRSCGLYILQSECDPTLYRLGETKNLSSRSGSHGGSAPRTMWKKAPNWTEVYRPWKLLWAASIPSATHLSLKMCEHHLHAVFSRLYDFVDESGFEASVSEAPALIGIANKQLPILAEITQRQRRPKFDKEAYYRAQWSIDASVTTCPAQIAGG